MYPDNYPFRKELTSVWYVDTNDEWRATLDS